MSPFIKDALERVAATFVEAFCASLVAAYAAGADITRTETLYAAVIAAAAASLSAVKAVAASFIGDEDSASLVQ